MSKSGSKIREQVAHFLVDIHIIDSEIVVENGKITATKVRGTAEYEG